MSYEELPIGDHASEILILVTHKVSGQKLFARAKSITTADMSLECDGEDEDIDESNEYGIKMPRTRVVLEFDTDSLEFGQDWEKFVEEGN